MSFFSAAALVVSASVSLVSAGVSFASAPAPAPNLDASKPALSRAFFAASLMASEVMVAPETASTSIVFFVMISPGSCSRAMVPMLGVSFSPVATTL